MSYLRKRVPPSPPSVPSSMMFQDPPMYDQPFLGGGSSSMFAGWSFLQIMFITVLLVAVLAVLSSKKDSSHSPVTTRSSVKLDPSEALKRHADLLRSIVDDMMADCYDFDNMLRRAQLETDALCTKTTIPDDDLSGKADFRLAVEDQIVRFTREAGLPPYTTVPAMKGTSFMFRVLMKAYVDEKGVSALGRDARGISVTTYQARLATNSLSQMSRGKKPVLDEDFSAESPFLANHVKEVLNKVVHR